MWCGLYANSQFTSRQQWNSVFTCYYYAQSLLQHKQFNLFLHISPQCGLPVCHTCALSLNCLRDLDASWQIQLWGPTMTHCSPPTETGAIWGSNHQQKHAIASDCKNDLQFTQRQHQNKYQCHNIQVLVVESCVTWQYPTSGL